MLRVMKWKGDPRRVSLSLSMSNILVFQSSIVEDIDGQVVVVVVMGREF